MAQIFISYKRADKDNVLYVKELIEKETGASCWIDVDGIESDAQFKNVIIRAINDCEIVLFMYSKNHQNIKDYEKDWTVRELNFARNKNKRIIFYNLDGSPLTDEFAFDYGSKQQVDGRSQVANEKLIYDIRKWINSPNTDSVKIPPIPFASVKATKTPPTIPPSQTFHSVIPPDTKSKNKTLWIVLGSVIGAMMLFVLIFFMIGFMSGMIDDDNPNMESDYVVTDSEVVEEIVNVLPYGWEDGENYLLGTIDTGEGKIQLGLKVVISQSDNEISRVYLSPDAEDGFFEITGEFGLFTKDDGKTYFYIDGKDGSANIIKLSSEAKTGSGIYSGYFSLNDNVNEITLQILQ